MNFLSTLQKLFQVHDKNPETFDHNPNFVTQPTRIMQMLRMLKDEATQIIIVTPDEKQHPSKILRVEKKGLLIDQFSSAEAHHKIDINTPIRIQAKQNAVTFTFKAQLLTKQKNKFNGYLISIPKRVYYPQKRVFFRTPLNHLHSITLKAALESSEDTLTGHVLDLSSGGLCLSTGTPHYMKRGHVLSPVSVVLDEDETIICELRIASVTKPLHSADIRIGCQFVQLDANTARAIDKFIALSERKRAKKDQKDV